MARSRGIGVRAKLALSYAGFLMLAGVLLLTAVWVFLLRNVPLDVLAPRFSNIPRVFDPHNFGPGVFGTAAVVVLGFLLVFGLLGGWLLAGRMLAPLASIRLATRKAGQGSLSHRIRLPGPQDEFRELADAFDAMLARLEAQMDEQRRFAANASHELRTPLAITQAMLDVARESPQAVDGDLIERLHAVNVRAIGLVEALLLLSRADQHAFAREPVDLSLIVEEAIESLVALAEKKGLSIEFHGDIAITHGSVALLLPLATNLLHNAIVHNLPAHGTVWVRTLLRDASVLLIVENSGDAMSPDVVDTLVQPFRRGSERVHADHAGVGLGLAIADGIVRAHDGELRLAPRSEGGLRVTVALPAAQTASAPPSTESSAPAM